MRMAFSGEGSSLVHILSECLTSACLIEDHAGPECLLVHPQIEKPYSPSHLRCCSYITARCHSAAIMPLPPLKSAVEAKMTGLQ